MSTVRKQGWRQDSQQKAHGQSNAGERERGICESELVVPFFAAIPPFGKP